MVQLSSGHTHLSQLGHQLSSGHTHLSQLGHFFLFIFFFSSDQSLVPLTPPRLLNVEIWRLMGGCLHIVFIKLHVKGLSPKCGPEKGPF